MAYDEKTELVKLAAARHAIRTAIKELWEAHEPIADGMEQLGRYAQRAGELEQELKMLSLRHELLLDKAATLLGIHKAELRTKLHFEAVAQLNKDA